VRTSWIAAPALALAGAYAAIPQLSQVGGSVVHVYNGSALLSAATLCGAIVVRRPRPMGPWLLIATALVLWVAGDGVYGWLGATTSGSAPDLAYVPAYGCLIAALVQMLRSRVGHERSDTSIDAAMIGVAGLMTMWELVIEPAWETEGISQLGRCVAALYPVLDVVLLVLIVQLLFVPGRKLTSIRWLAAGVATTFAADLVYAVLAQTDQYGQSDTVSRLLDSGWLVSYAFLAVAAWHPSMTGVCEPSTEPQRFGTSRLLACGAALLTAPVVHVVAAQLYDDAGVETLVASTVTVVPLAVWRIARLNRATQAALDEVARREAYYRGVAVKSSDAFVVIDVDGVVVDVSDALRNVVPISS